METLKKVPYISGSRNPKTLLIFLEMEFLSPSSKDFPFTKSSYIFRKWNFLALMLRDFLYFLKRKLFLYFRKWKFLIYYETETPKKSFIF